MLNPFSLVDMYVVVPTTIASQRRPDDPVIVNLDSMIASRVAARLACVGTVDEMLVEYGVHVCPWVGGCFHTPTIYLSGSMSSTFRENLLLHSSTCPAWGVVITRQDHGQPYGAVPPTLKG